MVSHPETGSDSPIGSDRDRGRDIDSLSRPHLGHSTAFTSNPCWNFHFCYKFLQNINLVNSTYFCIKTSNYIVIKIRKMD